MLIRGSCHCGTITFQLTWDPDPAEIPARACDCTFCIKHGGVWTSNPSGSLQITWTDPSLVSEYTFGTRTASFHVCRVCGVVPVVTSEIEGALRAVVNVNAFVDVPESLLRRAPISLGAEDGATRLARRGRSWIQHVQLTRGGGLR